MRTLILLIAIGTLHNLAIAGEKYFKSKPEKATVYLSGAVITYSEQLQLSPGQTELVFEGISALQYGQNIEAIGNGDFVIMDTRYEVRYPNSDVQKDNEKQRQLMRLIKQISDSVEDLSFNYQELSERLQILTTEKNLLLNNRIIKGDFKKDSLELVKSGMEYLHLKLTQINSETFKLKKEQKKLIELMNEANARLQDQQNKLSDLNQNTEQANLQNHCAIITVMCNTPIKGSIEFSYFSSSASWEPEYEIRTGATQKLKLISKAKVRQGTGVNWKEVKLTLSTSTPGIGHQMPVLNPYYLSVLVNRYKTKRSMEEKEGLMKTLPAPTAAGLVRADKDEIAISESNIDAQTLANYSSVEENMISVDYAISIPVSLSGNGKDYLLTIKEQEVDAMYSYYAVPKLDKNAFLMARVTGWEDLNIIPGKARIYNDNSFVAENYLDTHRATDTLEINLGRDKSFEFKRTVLKNRISENMISDKTIKTYQYEISYRNPKPFNVEIKILDQIPVSFEKEVVIEPIDLDWSLIDLPTGIITWKRNLKSKEAAKIKFGYTVTYPSGRPLAGL